MKPESSTSAKNTLEAAPQSHKFMAYPASTLSPVIQPTDLTTFKSRGIGMVGRDLQQKIQEMHSEYRKLVDEFNWNKLVYESRFSFEPVIGHTYHLYMDAAGFFLSMIEPARWKKRFIASLQLGFNGRWILKECDPSFHLEDYLMGGSSDEAEEVA